ncbi:Ribosomal protein S4 [Giardia lamblia P15]|uniref:40S ribosomal protein S4 n=1 Tax=Giardia intestinalis (strain P15) TaxID=658858 RepID=E1F103_GIAIA|nr:Ribosomal protein S4 [Giardia lamblia P15]
MARGVRKHLKRLNAPKHWLLDKMGGIWAPRPTNGPHGLRECIPLVLILRNRLHYANTYAETSMILQDKNVLIDGKPRTDPTFPIGFMDVFEIPKVHKTFRVLYDVKGRFTLVPIQSNEAGFKLCRVQKIFLGDKGMPYLSTHDARTIRFPHPDIKTNDTIKINLKTGKIDEWYKFDIGKIVMVTGGRNCGRIGTIQAIDKHMGSYTMIRMKDTEGTEFLTRLCNVFVIGNDSPAVAIPPTKGIRPDIIKNRELRLRSIAKRGGGASYE